MTYGVVYVALCEASGKVYVGQTTKPLYKYWHGRFSEARNERRPKTPLYHAIHKHGPKNFRVFKLAEASCKPVLDELERWYIEQYRATDRAVGYNICKFATDAASAAKASWANKTPEQQREVVRRLAMGRAERLAKRRLMKRRGRKPGQPQTMSMADVKFYVHVLMDQYGYTALAACDAVRDQFDCDITQSMVTRWRKSLRYLRDLAAERVEDTRELHTTNKTVV